MNELLLYVVLVLIGFAIGYFFRDLHPKNLKTKSTSQCSLEREQHFESKPSNTLTKAIIAGRGT